MRNRSIIAQVAVGYVVGVVAVTALVMTAAVVVGTAARKRREEDEANPMSPNYRPQENRS